MMFNNVKEAIYWIEHIKRKDKRINLDRMKSLLALIGNPERSYKTIHIAGTNGKGATCEMASSILIEKGYKVGRFVSPYILRFNERIVINHEEIPDEKLLCLANFLYPIVECFNKNNNDIIPFFEVVTALGFLYFKEEDVDIACIECGLGGLLDATNVINANCSIIPSIGYDHMKTLGDKLSDIAYHKLGIVKKGNHLITGVDKSLYNQFDEHCMKVGATIEKISKDDLKIESTFQYTKFNLYGHEYKVNLIGKFEALNCALAIEAAKYIDNSITDDVINKALSNIFWPGRLEIVSKKPLIILDGGHNISAINVVVDSLKDLDKEKKYTILYTALSDKESDKVINKLKEIAKEFVITTLDDPRAKDPHILMEEVGNIKKTLILNEFEAYNYIKENLDDNDNLLIIGSLHFVSSLRPYIINNIK